MSSDLKGAEAAVERHLKDGWDEFEHPIQWPGQEGFDPPDDKVWIQPRMLWGTGNDFTMGMDQVGKTQVVGVLNCNFFQKPGEGLGEMYEAADTFRDLFNRETIGSVRFGAASGLQPAGDPNQREWEQRSVEVPFRLIETL